MTRAAALRALTRQPEILRVPGVYDALSALLVERAGFPAAFLSGASLSFTRLGRPDLGLVSFSELLDAVRAICERISVPLIVDADTGFGNALNVMRTVRELEGAGAAAIQIEDQLTPKRCGHVIGKEVIPLGEMAGKLRAACDARRNADTVISARTDAVGVEGFDAALARAQAYAEAGADWIFIEGPDSLESMARTARALPGMPLVHNLVEGGASPVRGAAELQALGFRVALYPAFLVHLFARQAQRLLPQLLAAGTSAALADSLHDLGAMNELLDAGELLAGARRYAPSDNAAKGASP